VTAIISSFRCFRAGASSTQRSYGVFDRPGLKVTIMWAAYSSYLSQRCFVSAVNMYE